MMVNLFHFKILAREGMVDIIICRPKEMKRESLVEEDRSSIRKESNQNRNQEIIEDRPQNAVREEKCRSKSTT